MNPSQLRSDSLSARSGSAERNARSSPQAYSDDQLHQAAAILGLPTESLRRSLGLAPPASTVPSSSPVLDESFELDPLFSFEEILPLVDSQYSSASTLSLVGNPYTGLQAVQRTRLSSSPSTLSKYVTPMSTHSPHATQPLPYPLPADFDNSNSGRDRSYSSNGAMYGFGSETFEYTMGEPLGWMLGTPAPLPDLSRSGSTGSPNICELVTQEDLAAYSEMEPKFGPCSRNWEVPKKVRKQTKSKASNRKPKSRNGVAGVGVGASRRPRGAFTDDHKRELTAQTRELKGCIRCRMNRVRCWPDPDNVHGQCLTCKKITRPTFSKLPCLRYIITDASTYREQTAPYQLFSKRWQNMELVDITDWASDETKTITVSQIFLDAPYEVTVKEFIPVQGDMLVEQWNSGAVIKDHKIPRYALADMEETARMLQEFIDKSVANYILGALAPRNSGKTEDELLYQTYMGAFRHVHEAKSPKERSLLENCFRLWVGCRKTSNPHHIYGDDKLGGEKVDDPSSPFYDCVPMPVIMIAQMECIMYTKVLRPLSKKVLEGLNDLVKDNKRTYWLTIYFTIFILLHSCSMVTKRDEETAQQYGLQTRFANPHSIEAHHSGAKTMLAHFHWLNKGALPFLCTPDSEGVAKLMKEAGITETQAEFVHRTALLVQERATMMKTIREEQQFGHDFYWLSQLYDEDWKPGPSA